jgi:hypothetical protein
LVEITHGLRFGGQSVEVVVGWLDFYNATLGVLEQFGLGAAALAFGLGEEPTVGEASSAVTELGGEQDCGFEGLTYGIEKTVKGRVKGGFSGR